VPEIGDEIAVARALSDLGHRLLDAAAGDLEQVNRAPAHLVIVTSARQQIRGLDRPRRPRGEPRP
jgi:hypothetical protein